MGCDRPVLDEEKNEAPNGAQKTPLFNERPMFCAAAGLLLGVLIGSRFSGTYAWIAAAAVLCACIGARMAGRRMWMVALLLCAVGLVRVSLAAPAPVPAGEYAVAGRICETPEQADDGWLVLLDDASLGGAPVDGRIRLYADFEGTPAYGQTVSVTARTEPSDGTYETYDRYLGVSGTAFARETARLGGEAAQDGYGKLLALREAIGARIEALFPEGGGAAKGMLLGDKSGLDEETLEAFRSAGVAHLLAVSGLHVSVLAGAFSLLFRRNGWLRFFAAAAFCALYAALTACSPSVLRASVMLLVALLAFPLGRRPDPVSSLSAAFVLIVLIRPYALFQAGFQLSFLAVYGLALLAPMLQKPLSRLGSYASGLIAASAAVVIATFPACCACFGEAQLMSLVTNLLVLPIAPVFLIPAFLGTALSFVWYPLGNAVCAVARFALDVILAIATYGGGISLTVSAPPALAYLLCLVTMLLASRLCLRSPKRRAAYASVAALLTAAVWIAG